MTTVTCTKPQAAARQLNAAINLLFADYDSLATRTLAAAAYGVFADLVEHKKPGESWRSKIIEGSGLSTNEAKRLLNNAQNYLKHADTDPEAELSFDETENEHLIFVATLESGELGYPLSLEMQAFQIWYLAVYPEQVGSDTDPVIKSQKLLSDLGSLSREEQLIRGAQFVELVKEKYTKEGGDF
ncbi:MAG: hypothetical protein K8Q92_04855 [Methylophilales bacterium]|nr:hypothetical protein [Methylophilales bacterium]